MNQKKKGTYKSVIKILSFTWKEKKKKKYEHKKGNDNDCFDLYFI